jgi:hypothetical protein
LATEFLNKELSMLDRYEVQDALIEDLGATEHYSHLVPRVAACHRSFSHYVCDQDHQWALATESCGCRLCPHDQRKRAQEMAHRFQKFLVGKTDLKYVVFSERNCVDLDDGIDSLIAAWHRLRKSSPWSELVTGAVLVLEVTRNVEEDTWHPHLNVLFQGDYIPFDDLLEAWKRSTRENGHGVHIQKADAGTVPELVKYVTKTTDLVGNPVAIDKFLAATAGRRLIRTYGTFYRMPIDEEEGVLCCPDCQSTRVQRLGSLWQWQVAFDFEGHFRPNFVPAVAGVAMVDRGG